MEARALKDKASAFFTKGRFAKAAETYEEFCALDKKDHQARLRCGDAWSKAGKKDKAIGAYSMAAEGFARDGFLPRAIAASKLVLEIDPAHKGVQKMLAELYAQKSGGSRKPAAASPAPEMELTRNVSTPVSSTFTNTRAAIDLDSPIAAPKSKGYAPAKVEAPSPMNRSDALELPEYEIPMADGPSSVGGMSAQSGPAPTSRRDAIEIDVADTGPTGPKVLVETTIDIDLSAGQPVTGEVEIPIEGQPLTEADQLPPELQTAAPLAPAISFALPPPPPPESFELSVEEPSPAPRASSSAVYDLTDSVPDPKPSVPVFELTEVADAPPPPPASPPPAVSYEALDPEPIELTAPKPRLEPLDPEPIELTSPKPRLEPEPIELTSPRPRLEPLDAPLELIRSSARVEPLEAPRSSRVEASARVEPLDGPLEPMRSSAVEPLDAPLNPSVRSSARVEPLDAPLEPTRSSAVAPLDPPARVAARVDSSPPRSSALPPSVGDAASLPPAIRPMSAAESAPPGLKPRKADPPPAASAPAVPSSSPSSSRIWLPPTFTPATPRTESGSELPAVASAPVTAPAEPSTDLERSLQAFMQFDPDAPVAAPAPVAPPAPAPRASFTELDLDEGDSLLHAVEAAATHTARPAEPVEEAMDAPDDPKPEAGGLPKIPLFSDLPEDAFIALFEKCPLQRFEEGQLVFEQGEKADAFYVICGGQVRVFRTDGGTRKDLATLEEGSFFGEMALLSEAPRSASVEAAAEDTQVLVISAEILKELSASYPVVATALKKFCRQRMLSNLMNQAPIFAPFNRSDRRDLVQKFRARDVNKGDVLVKEGTISDGLYVVLSGEVAVEMKGSRIATLKEGQVFGEMSLLTRSPAAASVRAVRHTSLLRLPKPDFDGLILSHPQVLEHVSTLIDERKKSDERRQNNDAAEIL
jgi:CRP-like cAMP-binding protein